LRQGDADKLCWALPREGCLMLDIWFVVYICVMSLLTFL